MRIATRRALVSRPPSARWWLSGGIDAANAIQVYQAKGVASAAASYVNLANPGTYDAAAPSLPATVPDWASGNGWTFDGSSDFFNTGGDGTLKPFSAIARITPTGGVFAAIIGTYTANGWEWRIDSGNTQSLLKQNVTLIGSSSSAVSGDKVVAVTYSGAGAYVFYLDGSSDGSGTNDQTAVAGSLFHIGANNITSERFNGVMAALAIYNRVLTGTEISALTTAMAAL